MYLEAEEYLKKLCVCVHACVYVCVKQRAPYKHIVCHTAHLS
jgi:hypothetical protein